MSMKKIFRFWYKDISKPVNTFGMKPNPPKYVLNLEKVLTILLIVTLVILAFVV